MPRANLSILGAALALAITAQAHAAIDPLSGVDFAHISAAGNAPFTATGTQFPIYGRGAVNYEYNIGRTEVPTSLWAEFCNAVFDRPANDQIAYFWLLPPDHWGAAGASPLNPGGQHWSVPGGHESYAVGDISWRMAAMMCNWLCNGKSTDRSAFMNGAYDVATFGTTADPAAHNPGAQYWIPTWDEWIKASHYDPNKNGPGQGGYWTYSTTSDAAPVYGPPGTLVNGQLAQANAGWTSTTNPGLSPFNVPLGAYPSVQSPWGLLDTAGGTAEWSESLYLVNGGHYRFYDGSYWTRNAFDSALVDAVYDQSADLSYIPTYEYGLRIASSVPSPAPCALGVGVFITLATRRNRRASRRFELSPRSGPRRPSRLR